MTTIIVDPVAEWLLAEMSKKTGQDATELLTAALTAHAQAIGLLPAPPPPSVSSEERFSAMMAIAKRAAERPVFDPRRPDEIIGYNALGLPE
jgi:hypothetical protein